MKRLTGHPLMRLVSAYVSPRSIALALVLQPLLVGAVAVATAGSPAGAGIVGLAALLGLALWTGPLCSLLAAQRHYHDLRLPAPPAALRRTLWALLLGVNFAVPALAFTLTAPDAAGAGLFLAVLACAQLAVPAVVLMPFWLLWLAVPAAMLSRWWAPSQSVIGALPLAALSALAMAALVAWQGRALVRGIPRLGWRSSVLEAQLRIGRAAGADAMFAVDPGRGTRLLWWLMPHARSRAGDTPARRIALMLGPPFTPGSTRGQLAVLLAGCTLVAGVMFLALGGGAPTLHSAARSSFGEMLPWLWLGPLWSIDAMYPQRVATLFRRDRPELTEIALLPGLGGAARQPRALVHVIAWRSLQAYAAFIAAAMLVIAWLAPAQWPLPLAGLAGLALLWLDAARHLRRGRGLLPNGGVTTLAHVAAVAIPVGLLATGAGLVRLATLLALVGGLLFAAQRLHAAGARRDVVGT
jgi:hypothetical protein